MKKILFILVFLSVIHGAFSQATTSKDKKVRELLEVTGSGKMGAMMAQQMISTFQKLYPDVPEEVWEKFKEGMNADDFINMTAPVYSKYYDEEELDKLIAFYKTPLGQKVITVSPQIMQESMLIGREWGRKLGEKILNDLKEKGYQQKS